MTREDFRRRITDLLPDVFDQAMKNWLKYAKNLDRDGTETESEILDRSLVELAFIKRHQGMEAAATSFNYREKFIFNCFELRDATKLLEEGWPLERISDHTVESGYDPALEAMEGSHAALEEFQNGRWDTRESKWRFSLDLSREIRQFYASEQGLGGQDGAFSEWIRAAYEINEDSDQSFAEIVSDLCGALHDVDTQYGHSINRQFCNTLAVVLPTKIRSVAQYLSLGGNLNHVLALVLMGFLMEPQNHDSMLRAVKYMNDGGGVASAYYATEGEMFKGHFPQYQQAM